MKSFPKKYKPQELTNWSKLYKNNYPNHQSDIYNLYWLPTNKKLDCSDFFLMYVKDFYNLKKKQHTNKNLFLFSHDDIQNLNLTQKFFNKKRQTLHQVGTHKIRNFINSQENKKIIANNKIVESYFSSPYKIYINDSDFYSYVLNKLHSLRDEQRISVQSNITYWSFNLQTSIPTNNITWKKEKSPVYTIKYFIGSKCEALPVQIQDVDLCCGDVALLVHPKDKRYNKHIGKNAIIPLCNRQIPIIGDENVNITLNNGIQRICPCADQKSIQIAQKYGLPTNISVFSKEGYYTDYIHEEAFIGQERNKYYENIVGFLTDIANLNPNDTEYKEILVPYLKDSNERLVPYQIEELIINISEEKENLIQEIIDGNIKISSINKDFSQNLEEIKELKQHKLGLKIQNNDDLNDAIIEEINKLDNKIKELEQPIYDKINSLLPDSFICNSQIPFGRKIPLLKDSIGNFSFWNLEENCKSWKGNGLQICFNFVLLSLIREGIIGNKEFGKYNDCSKLCDFEKMFVILSENETKIGKIITNLKSIKGEGKEYDEFIKTIQNLTDENNSSISICSSLIENSEFIRIENSQLFSTNIEGIYNEVFNPDFIHYCLPCYLEDKNYHINDENIINISDEQKTLHELIFQKILLGTFKTTNIIEHGYDKTSETIINYESPSKLQIEQSQWNMFSLYGENTATSSLLTNYTYDEQEIILNNIFLKQIWNAVRLCIQKGFLPKENKKILENTPTDFDNLDLSVLNKLEDLFLERENIETFNEYVLFFKTFKTSSQDLFFSRYLEAQKTFTTKHVQFVCAYFFNFLFNVLCPLIPQYIEALIFEFNEVNDGNFTLEPIKPIQLTKNADFNINILYDTFITIKHARLEFNIKQHEIFNLFFKSTPSLLENFETYEQIFKNYFHIGDITYLRLHESDLPGYKIISDDVLSIGIKPIKNDGGNENSVENLEKQLKDLKDKSDLIRERMQLITDPTQLDIEKQKYEAIKEEMENITIKIALNS